MSSTYLRGAVAAAAILAASSAFATNLISVGDFSTPAQGGGWSIYYPSIDGWTSTIGDGIEIGTSANQYGLPSISPGGQNLELNANTYGVDSYTVTGLVSGHKYLLTYDYGARDAGGPSSATTSFGGVVLGTDGVGQTPGTWTADSFWVTATSSSENLVLTAAATGAPSFGNEYTNFSLTAAPELSTWAMMGLGFAGLAFAGARRARKAVSIAA